MEGGLCSQAAGSTLCTKHGHLLRIVDVCSPDRVLSLARGQGGRGNLRRGGTRWSPPSSSWAAAFSTTGFNICDPQTNSGDTSIQARTTAETNALFIYVEPTMSINWGVLTSAVGFHKPGLSWGVLCSLSAGLFISYHWSHLINSLCRVWLHAQFWSPAYGGTSWTWAFIKQPGISGRVYMLHAEVLISEYVQVVFICRSCGQIEVTLLFTDIEALIQLNRGGGGLGPRISKSAWVFKVWWFTVLVFQDSADCHV